MESIGTSENHVERDNPGARTIEGWQQLVKTTASNVAGKQLVVCNRTPKWWDEELQEAVRVERHTQYVYRAKLRQDGRSMLSL